MDKNYLQDVVPPAQKRSIRDIPIPNRDRGIGDIKREPARSRTNNDVINNLPPAPSGQDNSFENWDNEKPTTKSKSKKIIFILLIAIAVLLILLFFVFSILDKAIVKITPKTENSSFSEKITIEELSNKTNGSSLGYRIIELSQQVTKTVIAVDEKAVEEKASGDITIFNQYSKNPQKLIKNTRFESSDGRIYRIQDSIEIPGYTESDGKIIPGQLTVTVYADKPGEKYNLQSDTFTIPGFAGQEPFGFFSAKTATPINGGFAGIRKIVSKEDIENSSIQLQQELRNKLISQLQSEITDEFYVHYNDESFSFEKITQEAVKETENVNLSMRGVISAKIFNKVDISNIIADKLFASYFDNERTLISNFDLVTISLVKEKEVNDSNKYIEYLTANSSGSTFVWQIDQNQLKKDLLGVEKNSLSNIMKNYTEIQKAELIIKPFWRSSFPEKEKDIEVEIMI